jgi:PKD repeat protein
VSAGGGHSCALAADGSLACWGDDGGGQATPPAGSGYTQVSAGGAHSCAVAADGSLACWGSDHFGRASPPAGSGYTQVSAGGELSCGIEIDSTIACWGRLSIAQSAPWEANVAPVVTAIALPSEPVALGTLASLTATFTDANTADTHTATADWGEGVTAGSVAADTRTVSASYTYSTPGVYTVTVTVTDNGGLAGSRSSTLDVPAYVVVYDPSAGFVTGAGWIASPAGAYMADPTVTGAATFGFVSRYKRGANVPDGNTQFEFKAGNLQFHSTSYEWLVIAGAHGKFKGSGAINGAGDYGFMLTATDGAINGGVDGFRIKIWEKATEIVVYDNQPGEGEDSYATTALGGGNIRIHAK